MKRDVKMLYNKGNHLIESGRFEEAIACFDKALKINPRDVKVWRNKGNALVELGMLNEAVKCFNRAIEIDARIGGI